MGSKICLLLVVLYPLLFPIGVNGQENVQTGSSGLSCGAVEGDLDFISNEETLLRILPGGLQEKYLKDLNGDSCQERLERVKNIQGAFLAQGWQEKQTETQAQTSLPSTGITDQPQGVGEIVAGFLKNLFNITIGKLGFLNFIRFEATPTLVKDEASAFKESVDNLKKSICPGEDLDCMVTESLQNTSDNVNFNQE